MSGGTAPAPVWRSLTQAELDRQYNNRAFLPDAAELIARYDALSRPVRERHPPLRLAYGDGPNERLDLYRPPGTAAGTRLPVHVFVHGGAWQTESAASSAWPAPATLAVPALYAALDFDLVPHARLPDIVAQVRRAIVWIVRNVAPHGGDPRRLVVTGHSSGGHLAAMLAVTDWTRHGLPAGTIRAAAALSGMYDLEPVRLSYRNKVLALTPDEAAALSPIRRRPTVAGPILVGVGEGETDEFRRQARDAAAAWRAMGADIRFLPLAGNHYECVLTMADPAAPLGAAVRTMLQSC